MSQNIKLFKLSTSEEVIAEIICDSSDTYTLKRPRTLAPMQTNDGGVTLALIPWLMGAQDPKTNFESNVELQKISVVGIAIDPPTNLSDMYLQKTSGIELLTR